MMTGFELPAAKLVLKYVGGALAILLLLVSIYAKGRVDGRDICEGRYTKDALEWTQKLADERVAFQSQMDHIASQYEMDVFVLQGQVQHLRDNPQVVVKYVPLSVDAKLPKGFVELHDKASKGEALDGKVVDAAKATENKLSQLAVTVQSNYTTCIAEKKQLAALQETIRAYQKRQKELQK